MHLLRFAHRTNFDGTIDSVCYRCYVTVASARDELSLTEPETLHVCNPGRMLDLGRDLSGPVPHRERTHAA